MDDYGIKFTIEEELGEFQEYWETINNYYIDQLYEQNAPWVELVIRQDNQNTALYVSEAIGFGDEWFLRLTEIVYQNKKSIHNEKIEEKVIYHNVSFNMDSPLFVHDGKNIAKSMFNYVDKSKNDNNDGDFFVKKSKPHISEHKIFFNLNWHRRIIHDEKIEIVPFDQVLNEEDKDIFPRFKSIVAAVWGAHLHYLIEELDSFRYIGPLRERPDHEFRPQWPVSPERWASGLAAWDYMGHKDDQDENSTSKITIETTNKWLSSDYLKTGYEVINGSFIQMSITSQMYADLIGPINTPEHTNAVAQLRQEKAIIRLRLRDTNNNTMLLPTDVGTGISQVLPIIPLALLQLGKGERNILAIEQPELHLHPAMQTTLGDLFIEGLYHDVKSYYWGKKRFILETHSEHILLRLLRRIRENNEKAPENNPPLYEKTFGPEQLSIYFLEPGENGIRASNIRVDEEGDFLDPWPRGFFNERIEELF